MRMAASNPSREEAALAITGKPHDITQDVEAIQGVIAGEHAGIAAYRIAGESGLRSEEHTSELQSLMRISYAVFCLKKKQLQLTATRTLVNTTSQKKLQLKTQEV